ncbi:glycosyltransferase family A protein [Scytonema sp. PRP1]
MPRNSNLRFRARIQKITYVRNNANIGIFGNWQRTIEINSSSYLSILSDDDILLPNFIRESVLGLDNHPHAGLSAAQAEFIDTNGVVLQVKGTEFSDNLP